MEKKETEQKGDETMPDAEEVEGEVAEIAVNKKKYTLAENTEILFLLFVSGSKRKNKRDDVGDNLSSETL